jgi:UDP-N-acetylmuramate dehydrogenase
MSSSRSWPCAALAGAELAGRTTLRVGGRAEWLLEPKTPEELRAALVEAGERGLAVRVLGGGANLLVDDGTLPGVVMATERIDRTFRPMGEEANPLDQEPGAGGRMAPLEREADPRLVAWCGASMPGLVRAAQELGWSGLEGLVGVPGRIGGGVAMNAGGRWGELWDVVELVRVVDPAGEMRDLPRAECSPGYRNGNLGAWIVTGVVLRLEVADKAAVREATRQHLLEKNRVQPVTESTCGCVFKNPDPERSEGRSAGRLIDDCGLKGLAHGAAIVSPLHGNFIVNRGGATASDVLALIEEVRARVADKTGLELELEVKRWVA